jgi:hypothetical protein
MKHNFTIRRGALDGVEAALAVAEHRSFRKAAAGLGVTPSAMSQAIRSLEARVGAALFSRTTRSVGLTEAGERFLFRGGHQDAEDYCRQYDLSTATLMQWARHLLSAEDLRKTCRTSAESAPENVGTAAQEGAVGAPKEASTLSLWRTHGQRVYRRGVPTPIGAPSY